MKSKLSLENVKKCETKREVLIEFPFLFRHFRIYLFQMMMKASFMRIIEVFLKGLSFVCL